MWKLPRYLWCVKGNTQHKRAEFYWDPWNFKGPKQGRGVVLGPVEPEATQTGGQGSFIVPPGTWRDPDSGEGVSLVTPGTWRDPDRGEGVSLDTPGTWRDPDRGQGRCTAPPWNLKGPRRGPREFYWSPLGPDGTQTRVREFYRDLWNLKGPSQGPFMGPPWRDGERERVEKQWRWRRTLTCCLQQHSCLVSLPSSDTPGSCCLDLTSLESRLYLLNTSCHSQEQRLPMIHFWLQHWCLIRLEGDSGHLISQRRLASVSCKTLPSSSYSSCSSLLLSCFFLKRPSR